jgi:hypothetical protein
MAVHCECSGLTRACVVEQPIHCIVWAKDMLFATLFGPKAASELEEQEDEQAANADEDDETKLTKETAEVRPIW